jgi:hypothetical protein
MNHKWLGSSFALEHHLGKSQGEIPYIGSEVEHPNHAVICGLIQNVFDRAIIKPLNKDLQLGLQVPDLALDLATFELRARFAPRAPSAVWI